MKVRQLFGTLPLAALLAAPATAADMPLKAPPPPPAAFSWTGCYLGGHVGGAWVSKRFNGALTAPVTADFAPGSRAALTENDFGINSRGNFLGGGQVGCNYQTAPNWVIGIEADVSWTAATASANQNVFSTGPTTSGLPGAPGGFNANSLGDFSFKTESIATVTARMGYTWDRTLLYAKGGAAWARDKYSHNGQLASSACGAIANPPPTCVGTTANPTVPFNFSASETRFGWTIGAGIEWAFWQNWSVKLEYDYLDFGTRIVTFTDPVFGQGSMSVRQRISEVKFGLNYRFGPVVAAY